MPAAASGLATAAAAPDQPTTARRDQRSASTPPSGTATRNPTVRAASAMPSSVADSVVSSRARPSRKGIAQVARPDAVVAVQRRRNAGARRTGPAEGALTIIEPATPRRGVVILVIVLTYSDDRPTPLGFGTPSI